MEPKIATLSFPAASQVTSLSEKEMESHAGSFFMITSF